MSEANLVSFILKRKASQYMRQVLLLHENIMIHQACKISQQRKTDEIVVVDDQNHPVGIVTDEDILKKIGEAHARPERTMLGDIMTFPVISVKHDASLSATLELMKKNKIRKVVVVSKDDKVLGIIFQSTISDLIRAAISKPKAVASSIKPILWNLGTVLQFAGILMLIPSLMATYLAEYDVATGVFLTSTLLLISGFLLNSYGEKQPISLRGMAILVFSSFVLLILFGSIPYLYINPFDTDQPLEILTSGIFSSSAGFTTAGISLFDTPEELPQSFTFYRAFSQFVGGLSFIYLIMTAFYPEDKLYTMKGFISGQTPKLKELFGTLTIIFIIYAFIMTGLLWFFGQQNLIDNFSVSMSTLSTGGFLPKSNFLDELNVGGEIVIIAGMILGALPFAFHYGFVRKKFLFANISKEVTTYLIFLMLAISVFVVLHYGIVFDDVFTVIATSTTAGFQLIDMSTLDAADKTFITLLMIIGGCGFSTAGGIKIFRILDMFEFGSKIRSSNWKKVILEDKNKFISTVLVFALFPTVPLAAALYFSSLGFDFYDSYFEAIGAITTAGLGSGILGPHLDPAAKIVASFLMILGRLEIILLVFIFVPKLMR